MENDLKYREVFNTILIPSSSKSNITYLVTHAGNGTETFIKKQNEILLNNDWTFEVYDPVNLYKPNLDELLNKEKSIIYIHNEKHLNQSELNLIFEKSLDPNLKIYIQK